MMDRFSRKVIFFAACRNFCMVLASLWPLHSSAQLTFCNKTERPISVAISSLEIGVPLGIGPTTKGWYKTDPGKCSTPIKKALTVGAAYSYFATRSDGIKWDGPLQAAVKILTCVRGVRFDTSVDGDEKICKSADSRIEVFERIDAGRARNNSYVINFTTDGENVALLAPPPPPATVTTGPPKAVDYKVGQIEKRCIASWEDSHNIHSVQTILTWNHQELRTTMKKLEHCIELTMTGPIDIEGVGRSYVDSCINHGLNHQRTRHIIQALAALVSDITVTYGAATAAKAAEYVTSASNEILDCLTNTDKLTSFVAQQLRSQFSATIDHKMEWKYWKL